MPGGKSCLISPIYGPATNLAMDDAFWKCPSNFFTVDAIKSQVAYDEFLLKRIHNLNLTQGQSQLFVVYKALAKQLGNPERH